jgi:hypothetical protein
MNTYAETYRRIKYLQKQFLTLPHRDFPCLGAESAWKFLSSIIKILIQRFDQYTSRQLKLLNTALPLFEHFCGFLDDSEVKKVPWSIIPSLEELFTKIKPDTQFVISPLWETNYKIYNTNIIEHLDTQLLGIKGLLFDDDQDFETKRRDFFLEYKKGVYFVFYPRTERLSVLHFPLLGHEIGHIFSTEWLNNKFVDTLNKYDINKKIKIYIENALPPDLIGDLFKPQYIQRQIVEILALYKQIVSEILADIVGVYIFGHSALLSCYIFALKYDLDDFMAVPKGYLSWRFRLYFIFKALDLMKAGQFPLKYSNTNELINEIRKIVNTIDIKNYNYEKTKHKYIQYIVEVLDEEFDKICMEIETFLGGQQYLNIYSNVYQDEVVERLKNNITPNCKLIDNLIEKPIDLRNIVCGTWLFLSDLDPNRYEEYYERCHSVNLLSLKAIELSYYQKQFKNK